MGHYHAAAAYDVFSRASVGVLANKVTTTTRTTTTGAITTNSATAAAIGEPMQALREISDKRERERHERNVDQAELNFGRRES